MGNKSSTPAAAAGVTTEATPAPPTPPPAGAVNRRRRVSVSAEVDQSTGPVTKKVIPKEPAALAELELSVKSNFLFNSLPSEQLKEVLDAMEEKVYAAGDTIIKEGDDGDYFYVIGSGQCEVFITGKNNGAAVRSLKHGDSFGELALMYNAPRSATINANGPVKCWALDRATFRRTILASGQARRKSYEQFLANVDLLKSLTQSEIAQLADAVEPLTFEPGAVLIKEGDNDRISFKFYIIEAGEAQAFIKQDGEEVHMSTLGVGEYFGEKALVEKTPRTATVKAHTQLKCACLSIAAFERLMGPCEELLKARAGSGYHNVDDVRSGRVSPRGPTSPLSSTAGAPVTTEGF